MSKNNIFFADPIKDRLVCKEAHNLLRVFQRLNLNFDIPIREIMLPIMDTDRVIIKFEQAWVRISGK